MVVMMSPNNHFGTRITAAASIIGPIWLAAALAGIVVGAAAAEMQPQNQQLQQQQQQYVRITSILPHHLGTPPATVACHDVSRTRNVSLHAPLWRPL
jgi:anti-sigma factor RsiW